MRPSFLAILLALAFMAQSQQPSYYSIGADVLEGTEIYDIHQASDGIYWIATNKGVIRYDGYAFITHSCADALSPSMFGLKEDYEGRLYFHNLSGQVFCIEKEQCRLFCTIPDSLLVPDIGLEVDDLNRLVITAKNVIIVDDRGNKVDLPHGLHTRPAPRGMVHIAADSSLYAYDETGQQLIRLKHGRVTTSPLKTPRVPLRPYGLLVFRDSLYVYQYGTSDLLRITGDTTERVFEPASWLGKPQSLRYSTTKNSIWVATNTRGLLRLDEQLRLSNGKDLLFPKTLVSCVTEDAEGNILLGTFGDGLMVIPKISTEDFTRLPEDENTISITQSETGDLYFGTRSGNVFRLDRNGAVELFRDKQVKSVELLHALKDGYLLLGEFSGTLIDTKTNREYQLPTGSVKDVAHVSGNLYLLAANQGALYLDLETTSCTPLPEFSLRLYCIGYDPATETLYAGTAKGLAILEPGNALRYFTRDGQHVSALDIESSDGVVYVATAGLGILVFRKGQLIDTWNAAGSLLSDRVTHIREHRGRLYIATDKGMQVLDKDGTAIHTINSSDGLHSENIMDFEIRGNELWIAYGKGVQHLRLDELQPFAFTPVLYLDQVLVNDSVAVQEGTPVSLPAAQNNLQFHLRVNNLKYQREIQYLYRLEGTGSDWQRADFADHVIQFSSLSPGTYTFRAKAVCRGNESGEVAFAFTIAAPFWQTWWFYLSSVVVLLAITSLVYWRQLKAQQKRAAQINELNASKLTAIQSQMNPHFIFNALNSIQDLVLKGDIDNSYTYITQFADLVRRTLDGSGKDFIELSQEVRLIELYLGLEKLRFKGDLECSIHADHIEDVLVPPMLIQPFIENALVHGLLHKEGPKYIRVDFTLDDKLHCTITDNGVGRAEAEAIKLRRRQGGHESFSVTAIRKRFEILKDHFEGDLGFRYEDLQEDGRPVGTRVVLTIPVKRRF